MRCRSEPGVDMVVLTVVRGGCKFWLLALMRWGEYAGAFPNSEMGVN